MAEQYKNNNHFSSVIRETMIPQYRIFYSWQSDNLQAKDQLQQALDEVKKQFQSKGIAVQIEQGGGGCGFISIEDSVRIKIRRCDIFVGDVTPVGNVAMKGKLLPNANVIYEMGAATECMQADRILAVAMKGEWKVEDMPFDFNHYTMLQYNPDTDLPILIGQIKKRIIDTDHISRRTNNRFFSDRVVDKNIASGKYLPDTFLEDMIAKEKARMFVAPHKMYLQVYEQLTNLNFDNYNAARKNKGLKGDFKLNVTNWDIQDKVIDIERLRTIITQIQTCLTKQAKKMDKDGNEGYLSSRKVLRLANKLELMNKQVMVVTSEAGQGKTNFVCDLVRNVLKANGIPYVFTNAYELSAEQLAKSIAAEYNFIGDYSLEAVLLKAEHYCHQHLQYVIIVIDGLNEHPKQGLFKTNLARVLDAIKEHIHVKVLLTCRKQFYDKNYQVLQQIIDGNLYEVKLNKRHRFWDDSETSEDKCLMERYAKHFDVKEPVNTSIRHILLEDLLLMRIFFQGYQGQDLSKMTQIDYVDLYGRYYDQLCKQIQNIIEQETFVSNVHGMTLRIFDKIILWMVDNNVFTNLPMEEVLKSLTSDERQCFTAFLSANLLLKQDMPEEEAGVEDVLNFTYEQIRDYLVTRYLVDTVYASSKERFKELVEKYTTESNNQAEGTKMFLFLYVRIHDKNEVYELVKKQPWHDQVLIDYIWDIPDEKITSEEVEKVKDYIKSHADDVVKILVYSHWSPEKYGHLNIQVLFEVLEDMDKEERATYLETLWPSISKWHPAFGEPIVTPRGEFLSAIRAGIARRKGKEDKEREALERLDKYLSEGLEKLYIPRPKSKRKPSPYIIYAFDTYRYLMRVHKGKKEEFLAIAGVKEGFAKEMFGTIYDAIFTEAQDVEDMFSNYYANEYKDFEKFLSMHYSIPSDIVKKIAKVKDEADYRLIEFDALSYGGDTVSSLVMSDDFMERMYNWLNWQDDENKD